jgi:outer membrane receptor protein involved in Fe transport
MQPRQILPYLKAVVAVLGVSGFTVQANAQSQASSSGTDLEEILVTAQKTSQPLLDVPATVNVVSAASLENSTSLIDFGNFVPGLSVQSSGTPGQTTLVIRGISSGPNYSVAPLVGTYIDDMAISASNSEVQANFYSPDVMPYDLDHIEELEGPQGTLYGASAMGGLIKYVLKEPDLQNFTAQFGGDLRSIDQSGSVGWGYRGAVSVPVINDVLGFRLSGYTQEAPGYIKNTGINVNDVNSNRSSGGRLVGLWKPADFLSVKATAMISDISAGGFSVVNWDIATQQPAYGSYVQYTRLPQSYNSHIDFYSLSIAANLGFATLTNAASYSENYNHLDEDLSAYGAFVGAPSDLIPYNTWLTLKKFTDELRLASSNTGRLEWLLGAFYTREEGLNSQLGSGLLPTGAIDPAIDPVIVATINSDFIERAIFGTVTYKFSTLFDVTGGVRYTKDTLSFSSYLAGSLIGPASTINAAGSDEPVTWLGNARLHLGPDQMAYARVATGFRSGSPNESAFPGEGAYQQADTTTNYEVGFKGRYLGGRLDLNTSVFLIKWDKMQVTDYTSNGLAYPGNGGTATSQGAEATSSVQVSDAFRLSFGLTYTDAYLTENIPSLGGTVGNQLPQSPRWSATVSADYETQLTNRLNLSSGVSYRYRDTVFNGFPSSTNATSGAPLAVPMGPQNVVNAYVGLQTTHTRIKLFARNLFNNYSFTGEFIDALINNPQQAQLTLEQPRTLGLSVDYNY